MHIASVTDKQLLTIVSSVLITTEHCSQGQTGTPDCLELVSVVMFPKGKKQLIIPTKRVRVQTSLQEGYSGKDIVKNIMLESRR